MVNVLIIDDNQKMCEYMPKVLKPYENLKLCWSANSLEEAREILTYDNPDLIFLDIELPDGYGYELLPFIKQYHPGAYVVMLTAHYGSYRDEAYTHDEDDYLFKPIDPAELDRVVQRFASVRKKREKATEPALHRGKLKGVIALVNANNELCIRKTMDIPFFKYDGKRKMWSAMVDVDVSMTLKKGTSAKDILMLSSFYQQTHQAFIVNLEFVDLLGSTSNFVKLYPPYTKYALPVSRTYQRDLLDRLNLV